MYKQILTKNIDVVNGVTKDKIQLLNILMQLKKVCNHPYLFPKIEKGPPYEEGEHLIDNSMKLKILDVLLKRIYNDKNKVLIFSQMTSLLNILDDYCRYRGYTYCRIDGIYIFSHFFIFFFWILFINFIFKVLQVQKTEIKESRISKDLIPISLFSSSPQEQEV